MEVCTNPDILKVIYFFLLIIDIVKIIIPIALIILGLIDFSKAVTISDEKIQKKSVTLFLKRLLFAVLVFAVPWIVEVLMIALGNAFGEENKVNFTDCLENANSEKIAELEEIYKEEEKNNNNNNNDDCYNCHEQVKPSGSGNIKYKEETDTLKVVIELNERSSGLDYYTTYIWVKDAYKQFKSEVPDNYGKELLYPEKLMENAIEDNNLQNKLVVGINASGYEAGGIYYRTPAMPLVISNGKIIRDYTNKGLGTPKYNTYGINKNGILKYYPYGSSNQAQVANQIINDGVENTFGFVIRLVENGKVVTSQSTRTVLQGVCQINENNFVFVTDVYGSSRAGFTYKELANYMVKLGCKTGYNMDGGGSTQLLFKPSNSTPIKLITETSRAIPDIIYFHE